MDILQTGNMSTEYTMNRKEPAINLCEAPFVTQKEGGKFNSLLGHTPDEETIDLDLAREIKSQSEVAPTNEVADIVQSDGGWGWVVCFSSFVCNGVIFGLTNSFGILYVHIREKYAEEGLDNISFKASWVGSVCIGLTFLLSVVTGVLSDRFGLRKTGFVGGVMALIGILSSAFVENLILLYLTFGVIMGVGFALVFCPSFVILGHYFKRHFGLANGLRDSGGCIFTIAISLGLPEVLDALELRKTFLALSGLVFLLIPCTLTWKAMFPRRSAQTTASQRDSTCKTTKSTPELSRCCRLPKFAVAKLWRNKNFMIYMFAVGIGLTGYLAPFVHMVKYVEDEFPGHSGNQIILLLAISGGICRPLAGKLADLSWVKRPSIHLIALAIFGICELCIPFAKTYWGLVIVIIILGACSGVCTCLVAPIIFDLVGAVDASQALGFYFGTVSIPLTIGPPLIGLLYDHFGSYKVAFHVAGCFPLIGAFMMLFIRQPESANTNP